MAWGNHYASPLLLMLLPLLCFDVSHGESDLCQTLTTEIMVSKEKTYEYNGREVHLMCAGILTVNKCEGLCMSRVSPSVVTFPGFKKECKCCRESYLEDREVTLTECYDGVTLVPGQFTTMYIRVPIKCHCYNCAV